MGDPREPHETPTSTDGVAGRNAAVPASEEGTGIVPEDEGGPGRDTHLPASEADTDVVEDAEDSRDPSWPGGGRPGAIPPPD